MHTAQLASFRKSKAKRGSDLPTAYPWSGVPDKKPDHAKPDAVRADDLI